MELPVVAPLASLTPARERTILVEPALTRLFPDNGIRRGHVVGCVGIAARSIALALAARAVADGAWLAVVGIDDLGIEGAVELGVPAERVVAISATTAHEWAERLMAAADGFELIITVAPARADQMMRKVRQRLQARGAVVLTVPPSLPWAGSNPIHTDLHTDVDITTTGGEWLGIGEGHGRLVARRVMVGSSGRRIPRPVTVDCWLPGPDGRVDVVQAGLGRDAHDPRGEGVSRAS